MILTPPSFSLFPYTTLFRSLFFGFFQGIGFHIADIPVHGSHFHPGSGFFEDRKSTRLNSSHVAISYAVFCSKKKKCHPSRYYFSPDLGTYLSVGAFYCNKLI